MGGDFGHGPDYTSKMQAGIRGIIKEYLLSGLNDLKSYKPTISWDTERTVALKAQVSKMRFSILGIVASAMLDWKSAQTLVSGHASLWLINSLCNTVIPLGAAMIGHPLPAAALVGIRIASSLAGNMVGAVFFDDFMKELEGNLAKADKEYQEATGFFDTVYYWVAREAERGQVNAAKTAMFQAVAKAGGGWGVLAKQILGPIFGGGQPVPGAKKTIGGGLGAGGSSVEVDADV